MNQKKPGLESKNLHLRAVPASTSNKHNLVKVRNNHTMQKVTSNDCKSFLVQTKWSAILRQHIEMLDSHIKFLDQSLKRAKCEKPNKLSDPELEESTDWSIICQVMDTAIEVLTRSREAAVGIVSCHYTKIYFFVLNLNIF